MAGRERKHANDKVVERRVALLLRGEQTLDKERDIRDTRSDTHVLNSGPTQAQSKNECFIASDHEGLLFSFCTSAGCPCQMQISLFPKMVTPLARVKDPLLQPTFPFLCSQLFHM